MPPIELIDGEKLVDLLQEFKLGLKPVQTFEVEEAFFEEFKGGEVGLDCPPSETSL